MFTVYTGLYSRRRDLHRRSASRRSASSARGLFCFFFGGGRNGVGRATYICITNHQPIHTNQTIYQLGRWVTFSPCGGATPQF